MSSSGLVSRGKQPTAPASTAASIRSLSFGVASRITFTCGPAETIPRINAARSRSGMERSIKVTSGGSRRIEAIAASASCSSATRDMSGASPKKLRRPARSIACSIMSRTFAGSGARPGGAATGACGGRACVLLTNRDRAPEER